MKWNNLHKILILIGILVLFIPLVAYILWAVKPEKELRVLMVNKTVTNVKQAEHKSFFWTLNHLHYRKEEGKKYTLKNDYYGFIPGKGQKRHFSLKTIEIEKIDSLVKNVDLAYYADTYGVFSTEWYQTRYGNASTLIYGGLSLTDYLFLKEMQKFNKPVIAEFNFIDYPTSALNNYKITEMYGFSYTGWKGKYFSSLDTTNNDQLPRWMVHLYQKTHAGAWPFTEDGIILVKEGKSIVVLESGTHLTFSTPKIITDSVYRIKYKLPETFIFNKWFQIIDYSGNYETIASLEFEVNELGSIELENEKLGNRFPLIIKQMPNENFYLIAGDFSNNNIPFYTYRFQGVSSIEKRFTSMKYGKSAFFWKYYVPLMQGILEELTNQQQ